MGSFDILVSIILGIVEGITEWLPISSTGHMILLEEVMPFSKSAVGENFMEMFLVVIQLGAIMAVVVTYWERLVPFTVTGGEWKNKPKTWEMWFKIAAACIPAVFVELLIGDYLEEWFYRYEVVAAALIVFGAAFLLIEKRKQAISIKAGDIEGITYKMALAIGLFQVLAAVFPGTSRSGATILGALLIGVSRKAAAEFTFFLAVPVMFGASILKLIKFGFAFSRQEAAILIVGTAAAFLVSVVVIRFFIEYIRRHDFQAFGYYRIVLGIVVFALYPVIT